MLVVSYSGADKRYNVRSTSTLPHDRYTRRAYWVAEHDVLLWCSSTSIRETPNDLIQTPKRYMERAVVEIVFFVSMYA